MISRYAYSLHEQAALAILAADDDERRELLGQCEALSRTPGNRGTEHVVDEAGRSQRPPRPSASLAG